MIDTIESLANATLGLLISWAAVYWLWPIWGWEASRVESVQVTAVFFFLGFIRARVLRAVFRRFG